MSKKLSEMSLEELWQLFPVVLTEYQINWKEWYMKEEIALKTIFPSDYTMRINHIGSTAIEFIWAKPIIDILVEIPKESEITSINEVLSRSDYICMCQSNDRSSFCRGYTEQGFDDEVYHLHLRYMGDNGELYFRDYLKEYPCVAKEYEELKLSLLKEYEHNRDGYTDAKSDFISKYTELAKKEYGERYCGV